MAQFTQSFLSKKSVTPKTVLGFYATGLGIGLAACTSTITVLAVTGAAPELLPWVAGFGGGLLVLLLGGVYVINWRDTSKLMLSPVTGIEYSAIQQGVVLGDSVTGQRVAPAIAKEAEPMAIDAALEESEESND
jgi:hypothetical protein